MIHDPIAGCDISKHSLDLALAGAGACERFDNDARGIRRLIAWLRRHGARTIGLEPSGGYEKAVVKALLEAGFDVRFADARRVRLLAQAHNAGAKTDAIDAAFIARFIAETGGRAIARCPAREVLGDMLQARRALIESARRLSQQSETVDAAPARKALAKHAAALCAEAKRLEQAALAHVRAHAELARLMRLLMTAPGVGTIVAATLISEMAELGALSGKQIARLAGLAPYVRESGQWKGRAACGGGRTIPRNLLYLAAMAARRYDPGARAYFERLVAAGKPRMVALVALMRKLLTALNAMIRDQKSWAPSAPA